MTGPPRGLIAIAALVVAIAAFLAGAAPLAAAVPQCYEQVDLNVVEMTCEYDGESLQAAQASTPSARWVVYQLCKDGTSGSVEACSNPRACTVGGTVGTLYAVVKNGRRAGLACLTAGEATAVDDPPIRVLVIQTFKRLQWSPSTVVVQPPGGKTLVNLETNFYTENVSVTSIPVRLQGVGVVVSARPIAYRWHFGDGTSATTTSPGAPYPDLDVAHVYDETDKVAVSVDTQYGDASFTVDGGPPQAIPSTIWISGADTDLRILEAVPQLVLE